jgi:hypothetical protein
MKNSLFILILFLTCALSLSSCLRDKAEALVEKELSTVPPETFLNINFKPRGSVLMVNFPSDSRIGYVQLTVKGYDSSKPQELKFYHPTTAIQEEIDAVCRIYNISQEEILPFMHGKITAYLKIGASQVRGINPLPYIAFQYADDIVLYYVKDLPQDKLESFVTSNELQVLNKSWLYKKHESDILR